MIRAMASIVFLFVFASAAQSTPPSESFHQKLPDGIKQIDNPECKKCHPVAFKGDETAVSAWNKELASTKVRTPKTMDFDPAAPDPFSLACLHCHDGSLSKNTTLNTPLSPCGLKRGGGVSENGANHPVFIRYPDHKNDLKGSAEPLPPGWNNAEKVNDLLRHEKIVCISCHVPHHTQQMGYLRTNMRGSALCFGCHIK